MCSVNKTYGPYDVEPVKLELNGSNITALEKMGNDEIDLAFIHYYNHHEPLVIGHVTDGERVCIYPATPKRGQVCGYVFSSDVGHEGVVMFLGVVGGNSGSVIFNGQDEAVGVITSRDFLFAYGTSFDTIELAE
jgi:CBS domain-containing protein